MINSLYPPFRHWSNTGTIWIYSDTHFNDILPIQRPDADAHVRFINSFVGRKDTLIVLGDIGDIEYAKKLKGYKILIMGNHDEGHTKWETVFDEVYPGPLFISEKLLLSHERIDLPFAYNIHGHDHIRPDTDNMHTNVCADIRGYVPLNLTRFIRTGGLAHVKTIHRQTIDHAADRAKERGCPQKDRQIRKKTTLQ